VKGLGYWFAGILLGHHLRNAVDQDVLVIDRGQAPDAGRNLHYDIAVLVAQYPGVGLGGERENRTLHACHVVLGDRIEHVADEEIVIGMALGEEGGLASVVPAQQVSGRFITSLACLALCIYRRCATRRREARALADRP
jgi:hypothetical protein